MAVGSAVVFDIVEQTIGDFEDGLVRDILVGLNPEFDAFEALRELINELLLDGVARRGVHC